MNQHEPVLLKEVIDFLHIKRALEYIDATLGTGGHSLEIIKRGGRVLGIDADESMLEIARKRLEGKGDFKLVHGNFKDIAKIAEANGFGKVNGILFDLGVSNVHFKTRGRGFSFIDESSPLDMRLDPENQRVTAADLVNALREDQLEEMFGQAMPRHEAAKLAGKVVESRVETRIETVADFLRTSSFLRRKGKLNPATKAFLAMRIAVNLELKNLEEALPGAFGLLASGGSLLVISFHSLEDRLVKNFFKEKKASGEARIKTKKPLVPSEEEVKINPKSRSARLRVLIKI